MAWVEWCRGRDVPRAGPQASCRYRYLAPTPPPTPPHPSQCQVIKRDMKQGKITRDELVAHAFLLLVRGVAPRGTPEGAGAADVAVHA